MIFLLANTLACVACSALLIIIDRRMVGYHNYCLSCADDLYFVGINFQSTVIHQTIH